MTIQEFIKKYCTLEQVFPEGKSVTIVQGTTVKVTKRGPLNEITEVQIGKHDLKIEVMLFERGDTKKLLVNSISDGRNKYNWVRIKNFLEGEKTEDKFTV